MLLSLLIVTSSSLDLRIVSSSHQNQCHHSRINLQANHFLSALLADPEVDSCLLVSWTLAGVLVSHLTIYGKYNCTYVFMIQ